MQYYKDQLIAIRQQYISMRDTLLAEAKTYPQGKLSSWNNNGRIYYRRNYKVENKLVRDSITNNEITIQRLARKEYITKLSKQIDKTIAYLTRGINNYPLISRDEIIASMNTAYKTLPTTFFDFPVKEVTDSITAQQIINDPDYLPEIRAKQWAAQSYTKSDFKPEELIHVTSRGELMRSKSEVLIAEQYYSLGIDFRYEAVMRVGRYEFAPDFVFFGKNGEPFYHEHAGMMGELKYRTRHDWKMARYKEAGIVPWKNLIITYDYDDHINMQEILAIINGMVKPRLMYYNTKTGGN